MTIDWLNFTPVLSALGGVLIGLAAGGLVLLTGRIAGISGILGGLLRPRSGETRFGETRSGETRSGEIGWRVAFLAGLLVAPEMYRVFAPLPDSRIDAGWLVLLVAGLLVGVGTRYGAGCTSGHGVCGLSRLSPRSLGAVIGFMAAGFLTVFVTRHVLG